MTASPAPLRLSIDATALANPARTGIGRMLESLLPELVRLAGDEARIRLFAGGRIHGPSARLLAGGPSLDAEIHPSPSLYLWQQFGMSRAIGKFGPTVHLAPEGLLPLRLAAPAVGIVHDLLWLRHPETCKRHVRAVYHWRFRPSLRRLSAIQYDSAFTRSEVRRAFPGCEPAASGVVPLGVSPEAFHPVTDSGKGALSAFRSCHDLPSSYLLAVGNLRRHKNLEVVLRALRILHNSGTSVPPLAVVGAGKLDQGLESLRAGLPAGTVRLLGYLDEEQLLHAYQGAGALIFPSRYEGFGLPLLEAMSVGIPVVYAQGSALSEVAGDVGLSFDPDHADGLAAHLRTVLYNAARREQLSASGLERARRFTWRQTAEALWTTLERTAHESRRSPVRPEVDP